MIRTPRRDRALAVVAVVAVAVLAACGGGGGDAPAARTQASVLGAPDGVSSPVGPGIPVADARSARTRGLVLVTGYLVVESGRHPRLCDRLGPGCAGASLVVVGLPRAERERMASDVVGEASVSPEPVQLLGRVRGRRLRVAERARA